MRKPPRVDEGTVIFNKLTQLRSFGREHYQWNMDIWGVHSVEAEAELLSAIVTFFQSVGLRSQDVGIKVNNRKIVNCIVHCLGLPDALLPHICSIVDKIDKIGSEQFVEEVNNAISTEVPNEQLRQKIVEDLHQTLRVCSQYRL